MYEYFVKVSALFYTKLQSLSLKYIILFTKPKWWDSEPSLALQARHKFAKQIRHERALCAQKFSSRSVSPNKEGRLWAPLFIWRKRWDTRLWRDFFATPLVSKLTDGFGSKPNPILLRKGVFCCTTSNKTKKHTARCAFLFWRKRWDSNPRYREVQLISSQSRYDHFDTLPYCERDYYSIVSRKLQGLF